MTSMVMERNRLHPHLARWEGGMKTLKLVRQENEQARDTDAQSIESGKKKLTPVLLGNKRNEEFNATSSRFNSVLNEQKDMIPATSSKQNEVVPPTCKITAADTPATSSEQNEVVPPTREITAADTPADVQSMWGGGDKMNPSCLKQYSQFWTTEGPHLCRDGAGKKDPKDTAQ